MTKFAFLFATSALVAFPAGAQRPEPPAETVEAAQAAAQADHVH